MMQSISLGKAAPVSKAELALNKRMQTEDRRIARANKTFNTADAATKRVIIAKDVITWLNIGKLKAAPGLYLRSKFAFDPETNQAWAYVGDAPYEMQARALVTNGLVKDDRVNGGTCAACALGGLFACAVERADGFKPITVSTTTYENFWDNSQSSMHEYLRPYFELEQLLLIESAFERADFVKDGLWTEWANIHNEEPSRELRNEWFGRGCAAADKFRHIGNPSDRMRAIMENVIANGGTFVV